VRRWARTLDRPLPWRGERDPYRILVSEVMLQQTQAARVAPIYERFIERFGDVGALAAADLGDVLRAWENLGYNRRAMSLWRCARAIVALAGFPSTVEELSKLPGVGAYTARAVASFAFDVDAGVVDANVRRVLERSLGVSGSENVQAAADAMAPRGSSASWNQAMIDLGAVVCRARSPRCDECPLRRGCSWTPARPTTSRTGQLRFADTTRYARGRVIGALRERDRLTLADIARLTELDADRTKTAVASLEAEGLLTRKGRCYALGSAGART